MNDAKVGCAAIGCGFSVFGVAVFAVNPFIMHLFFNKLLIDVCGVTMNRLEYWPLVLAGVVISLIASFFRGSRS